MSHIFLPDREGKAAEYLLMIGWLTRDKKSCLEIIINTRLLIKCRIKLGVVCISLRTTYLREILQLYITLSSSDQDLLVVLPPIWTHTVDTFFNKENSRCILDLLLAKLNRWNMYLTDYCCTVSLSLPSTFSYCYVWSRKIKKSPKHLKAIHTGNNFGKTGNQTRQPSKKNRKIP